MSRPYKLSPDEQRRFAELWADPGQSYASIAGALAIGRSAIPRYARALDLPHRRWPRSGNQRPRPQGLAGARTNQIRGAARQLARLEHALAMEAPRQPPDSTWRRCSVCDGRECTAAPHAHAA